MWPFARKKGPTIADAVAEAIELAAKRWTRFCESGGVPANIHLRDRLPFFAGDFRREMDREFPILRNAPEQLVLLIIAEGIHKSGLETRRKIELQLGIVLPETAAVSTMATAAK